MPPEGHNQTPSKMFIDETWDRFSMAIVFYQILFGLHPFCITPIPSFSTESTVHSHIKSGLFPFGQNTQYIQIVPKLHDKYYLLPKKFRLLFIRSFDIGHENPNARPTAREWGSTIFSEIKMTTSHSNFTKSSKKSNTQKKNKNPNWQSPRYQKKIANNKNTIKKKEPKSYFKGILYQLIGVGLFYSHPHFDRKWIYLLLFAYASFDLILANERVEPFDEEFGLVSFLVALFVVYVIGTIDVIVSINENNRIQK